MLVIDKPFSYPLPRISVLPLDNAFEISYPAPSGLYRGDQWPPLQAQYLRLYLKEIACKTVILEHHYIDRVFMHDDAVFYVRNLRCYPNFTQRMHFFTEEFSENDWKAMIGRAAAGEYETIRQRLQAGYRGFSVVRPLPGRPVGRTVLPANPARAPTGSESSFKGARLHSTHLAGFELKIVGVPFQSQDESVSACATAALWSALDSVAGPEEMQVSSPASIAEAATRYPLQDGPSFPTEGLSLRQICEATRVAGFSPIVFKGNDPHDSNIQIYGYAMSGFAPILCLVPTSDGSPGHAVCTVGLRVGPLPPRTDPSPKYGEAATALMGVYIHDDRLGPYAFAQLSSYTDRGKIRTRVTIEWPDSKPDRDWLLHAVVVPVPVKLRLTIPRMRRVAHGIAEAIGDVFNEPLTTLTCTYEMAKEYGKRAYSFGLSSEGLYELVTATAFSRYVGVAEISTPAGPVMDVIFDTTETNAEPAVLTCVKRSAMPNGAEAAFQGIAEYLGSKPIS